jgi:hypothetical protein
MLDGILWRCGIEATDIVSTSEDVLYSFDIPKGIMTKNEKLNNPKVRKLTKVNPIVKKHQTSAMKCITGGKTGLTDTRKEGDKLSKYVNEECLMFVSKETTDDNGQRYIEMKLEEDLTVLVRAYAGQKTKLWNTLLESVNSFSGVIKALKVYKGQTYLLVDLRTLTEVHYSLVDEEGEESVGNEITTEGYNGEQLTYTQFKDATSEGCSWCTGNAEFGQPTVFINRFDFFCHNCLKDSECQEYLEGVGNVN